MKACIMVVGILLLAMVGCSSGGGDGSADPNAITASNLRGTYDLGEDEMTSAVLEVDGDTLAFTVTVMSTGTFTISGNTLTITDGDGGATLLQATLTNNGTTLSLVEEDSDTLVYDRR